MAMYVATSRLRPPSTRIHKVIDTRTHGLIDYCHAIVFLGMALLFRKSNPRAATAALLTGSFVLAQSLLTDYPLGVAKVFSFATHGRMDAVLAASSPLIPSLFGFKGTAAARVFQANCLIACSVVGLTDFGSHRIRAEEQRLGETTTCLTSLPVVRRRRLNLLPGGSRQ
jgi:hypothetical protein